MTELKQPDPAVIVFMLDVMEALGVRTAGQLVNLLVNDGYIEASQARKVHRWVAGTSAPDHAATLYLLRRASLLSPREAATA